MLARCYLRFIYRCTNFVYMNFRPIWILELWNYRKIMDYGKRDKPECHF